MSKCTWREDADGDWHTDCGGWFDRFGDTPVESGMVFCCYCGGKLVEVDYTEPPRIAATISLCCNIVRIGWQKPGVVHSGACRDKHGQLGETYYLTDSGLVMDDDGKMRKRT